MNVLLIGGTITHFEVVLGIVQLKRQSIFGKYDLIKNAYFKAYRWQQPPLSLRLELIQARACFLF